MLSRLRAPTATLVRWVTIALLVLLHPARAAADEPVLEADPTGLWCVDAAMHTRALRSDGLSSAVRPYGGAWLVADGRNGVVSVALSNGRPAVQSRLSLGGAFVLDVAIGADGHAWVASEQGVSLVDASRGSPLRLVGALPDDPVLRGAHSVAIDGAVLWVAAQHTLRAYAVDDRARPRLASELRVEAQDVHALQRVGSVLLAEFAGPRGGLVTQVFDVRSPERPVAFEAVLPGRVFEDEGRLFLAAVDGSSTRLSRLELDAERRTASTAPVVTLPTALPVLGVAGPFAFVGRFPRGIAVVDVATAQPVGAILGDFATGTSRTTREGSVVALATRFGGTQFFDLREFAPRPAVRRLAATRVTLSRAHGDYFSRVVRPGDSVSSMLARGHVLEAGAAWRAQMTRFARMNAGVANPDVLRPGQRVLLPIPERVFCSSAASEAGP